MFYAQLILAKKGVLGKIWLAAHWDKKLNRQLIFQTDVTQSAGKPHSTDDCQGTGLHLVGLWTIRAVAPPWVAFNVDHG
jgi:hypothetical protein